MDQEFGEIALFGRSIIRWRRRKPVLGFWFRHLRVVQAFKYKLKSARRGNKELKGQISGLEKKIRELEQRLLISESTRNAITAEKDILESNIEMLVAWRDQELERLQSEARIYATKSAVRMMDEDDLT